MWESPEQKRLTYLAAYGGTGKTMKMLDTMQLDAERQAGLHSNVHIQEEIGKDYIKSHIEAIQKAREDFIKYNPNPCVEIELDKVWHDCILPYPLTPQQCYPANYQLLLL